MIDNQQQLVVCRDTTHSTTSGYYNYRWTASLRLWFRLSFILPVSASLFIISLNWFPRVKLGWERVTSKHSEVSYIMLRPSATKFLGEQVKKKSIYASLSKNREVRRKGWLKYRCRCLLSDAVFCSSYLQTIHWNIFYIGLLCQPIPLWRHKLPFEWKVME